MAVCPLPINGSKTISSAKVYNWINLYGNSTGKGAGMTDFGCRFSRKGPDTFGKFQKFLFGNCVFSVLRGFSGKSFFWKDQNILMNVSQDGVFSRLPCSPGCRGADAWTFVPDDFPSHQKTKIYQVLYQENMQRQVWLPSQVSNIYTGSASRNQDSINLFPDSL